MGRRIDRTRIYKDGDEGKRWTAENRTTGLNLFLPQRSMRRAPFRLRRAHSAEPIWLTSRGNRFARADLDDKPREPFRPRRFG